jgi:SAM-dependent methyltransferase
MDRLTSVLTEAYVRIASNPGLEAVDWLAKELGSSFDEAVTVGELPQFQAACRSHPLASIFLQDPYSRRAVEKPRGYAGDAVMLDYIYRPGRSSLDGVAGVIHEATTTLPNAKSILWRQEYLASLIAQRMREGTAIEVLSVASGHMRELDVLPTITASRNVHFTALDTDADSIAEAKSTYSDYNITGKVGSFATLIRDRKRSDKYELIYSAGLFDYLQDSTATALVASMYGRLKPGGVLSIGNFTRNSHGRGFMAGFMDWCLLYRDESDMRRLVDAACPKASHRIFRDQPGNVVYLEIFADADDR